MRRFVQSIPSLLAELLVLGILGRSICVPLAAPLKSAKNTHFESDPTPLAVAPLFSYRSACV